MLNSSLARVSASMRIAFTSKSQYSGKSQTRLSFAASRPCGPRLKSTLALRFVTSTLSPGCGSSRKCCRETCFSSAPAIISRTRSGKSIRPTCSPFSGCGAGSPLVISCRPISTLWLSEKDATGFRWS